jgi:hypothetical protein
VLRKMDIVIILIYVAITAALSYLFLFRDIASSGDQRVLVIQQEGTVKERITLPVAQPIRKRIEYKGHFNDIVVSKDKVYIEDADCYDKLCVKMGEIYDSGQMIVCLPNKLVLQIEKLDGTAPEGEVDVIVN